MNRKIKPPDKGLEPGFDTTAELWDRIADDLADNASPCYETVEKLLVQACGLAEEEGPESGS